MIDLDSLFWERDLETATRRLETIRRYARKREAFLGELDLDQLGRDEVARIAKDDEALFEALAYGHFYLIHLADLEAHAPEFQLAA